MTDNQFKVNAAKAYLASTDYIIIKISEATALGDTSLAAELVSLYNDEISKRKESREVVSSLGPLAEADEHLEFVEMQSTESSKKTSVNDKKEA